MSEWMDITALCREACRELASADHLVKPMVNTPQFSLQESMSAVELMDCKMDQCTPHVATLHQRRWTNLYQYHNLPTDVSLMTILPELQHSFAMLMLFVNGASIMESTHQFVHFWQQSWPALEHHQLTPFTKNFILTVGQAMVLSVSSIYNAVMSADIYEDEDFSPNLRHLLPEAESLGIDDIHSRLTDIKSQLISNSPAVAALGLSSAQVQELVDFLALLTCSTALFRSIETYVHRTILIATKLNRDRKQHQQHQQQQQFGANPEEIVVAPVNRRDYGDLLASYSALPTGADLQALSKAVLAAGDKMLLSSTATTTAPTTTFLFHPELAKLHLIVPVRKLEDMHFNKAVADLKQICADLQEVCTMSSKIPNPIQQLLSSTPTKAHNITIEQLLQQGFYMCQKKFHLLNRSIYVASIHCIALDVETFIFNSMAQRGVPAAILTPDASTALKEWITGNPSYAAWETLKTLCVTRTRIAIKMENLVSLWGNVAAEALYVDEQLRNLLHLENPQQWCTSWSVIFTTMMMDFFVSLLTEMDVLDVKEWDNAFWYWDYICATNHHAIDKLRAHRFQLDMTIYEADQQQQKKAAATKKGKKQPQEAPRVLPAPTVISPFAEDLATKGRGQLCRGIFRTMIVLKQLGLVPRHSNAHTTAGHIFERRFRPFQEVVNPAPLSYKDFILTINKDASKKGGEELNTATSNDGQGVEDFMDEQNIERIVDLKGVINGSIICFQNARKHFDDARKLHSHLTGYSEVYVNALNKSIVALTKVAVASAIAVTKFSQLVDDSGNLLEGADVKISFNQSYHISYPVIESSSNNK